MQAETLLREGKLDEALGALEQAVRKNPADPKLRVFMFQLLAVRGEWERALTQLNVAAEMDPANLLMAQVCRPALNAEAFRAAVFAGARTPLVMGEPAEWVGWMIQANALTAQGQHAAAEPLRARALEAAPAAAGTIDGEPFEWIADADSRTGPLLEAVVEGKYYWIPFTNISAILIEKPADLRDVVWSPAHFRWATGGETVGLIPTRYPGSESAADAAIRLARRTDWTQPGPDTYTGLGQRVLSTDAGDHGLMETRLITIGAPPEAAEGGDG